MSNQPAMDQLSNSIEAIEKIILSSGLAAQLAAEMAGAPPFDAEQT